MIDLAVVAVTRGRDEVTERLVARYAERLDSLRLVAVRPATGRGLSAGEARREEAGRLRDAVDRLRPRAGGFRTVALDERGRTLGSTDLAHWLRDLGEGGVACAAFLVGGDGGLEPDLVADCDARLSLSAMTLPHGLARVVLVEQLYRAHSILSGHPYHRA